MKRLVVLISGYGSNLQAILDACQRGELPAQVVAVISNKADAFGLQRAIDAGVPAIPLPFYKELHLDRAGYDEVLAEVIEPYQPDLIVCAGWMRILGPGFVRRFAGKIINLHPALPGMFPGMHSIEAAYQAFRRGEIQHTGVMVHYVDEGVDTGPVIATRDVPIYPTDTLKDLEQRIHQTEHELLVEAIASLIMRSS
ncbi:MAG: phosphoribosylglycinamide formyltransferase [Thermoflexales bacterium]|nr:phosphoribosylglycinamide formyltransferase [Thermoflexales bacterium]MDW8350809.1 phosphoribosylglycinamide formyltransferase [Anaerolineae bacterium]